MAYAPTTGYQAGVVYQAATGFPAGPAYQGGAGYQVPAGYQEGAQYQGNPWETPVYPNSAPGIYCPLPPGSGSVLPTMVYAPVLPSLYPPQ